MTEYHIFLILYFITGILLGVFSLPWHKNVHEGPLSWFLLWVFVWPILLFASAYILLNIYNCKWVEFLMMLDNKKLKKIPENDPIRNKIKNRMYDRFRYIEGKIREGKYNKTISEIYPK
jgi:ABC-type dipeptide/oligopeptide/nickel transport system permease component